MKQVLRKRLQAEPTWCELCHLRIAPYEEAVITPSQSFHKHCSEKAGVRRAPESFSRPRVKLALS